MNDSRTQKECKRFTALMTTSIAMRRRKLNHEHANGWTKLNLDAYFCEVTCTGSWRVVLQNEAKVCQNIQNSATAKAAAHSLLM
jgi:hypothetical protein